MGNPAGKPYGNGVLLWFQIEDFGAAVERARALCATWIRHRACTASRRRIAPLALLTGACQIPNLRSEPGRSGGQGE